MVYPNNTGRSNTWGMSKRVLAVLAGHQSIATTQRYIDINDDMLRNAVELI
jgi:integrase/recombinase XerD